MKIGIDARVIDKYPGLGRVCINLIKGIASIDKKNTYLIFGSSSSLGFLEGYHNFQTIDVGFPVLSLRTLLSLGGIVKKEMVDIFHSPFQITTMFPPCPLVITVHDMMDLFYKDAFSHHPFYIDFALRAFFRFAIPRTVDRAAKIIAVSENTKRDIIKYLHTPDGKIKVVLNGVEETFKPIGDEKLQGEVRKNYGLPERYILYLGSTKAYKNLDNAFKAFATLKRLEDKTENICLVIAGLRHFARSNLNEKIENYGMEADVINIGYVAEEDLPIVYSMAELLLFPSLWEGFGLPALEAMACGVPVVTSNTSSLPEVVGDAGILVNPEDTNAIAKGMQRILSDRILKEVLTKKGIERARGFSWEEAAKKTIQIYYEIRG
jgi:glycosyltransferase involved in cell wall biosynthesis